MKLTENVTQKYDHYYKYDEIKTLLEGYAKKYPEYTKLETIGVTPEGRNILLLEVTDTKTGDFSTKPAFYVEGNIHAGEVTGCMTCMYFLDTIFTNIESKEVKELLKKNTIYVLPRVSPDGSEYYLTTPDTVRSAPRFYPFDTEQPGIQPADLDNDGVIRKMRVKSPYGIWKKSDKDPRVMLKRRPDDTEGEFYNVYSEGYVKDYDGFELKSAPGKFGNDFNRNYPIAWQPEYKQRGSGKHPLSNPETKANADFLLSHNNVCMVVDMHTSGGQFLYTPGYKSAKECPKADIDLYKTLGKMGTEENGFPCLSVHDEYVSPGTVLAGGFYDFVHFLVGIPCMTIECWDHDHRAGIESVWPPKPQPDEVEEENMYKYMKWLDEKYDGEGFKAWTKFNHPELGEVEIGGFDYKFTFQNPPTKSLHEEIEQHVRWFFRVLKTLPQVSVDKVTTEELAKDLYKLTVVVGNKGYMPSYVFKEGLTLNRVPELKAKLSNVEVVEGKEETSIGHLEGLSGIMGRNGSYGPMNFDMGPHQKKLTYVIKAKKGTKATLTISGDRIGTFDTTFEVK